MDWFIRTLFLQPLDLSTEGRHTPQQGGDDGALVKPGDPDKSPLYESIKAGRMPPDGKPGPTEKEMMLIRDWIAGGAKERRRTVRRRDLRTGRTWVRR